MGFTDSFKKIIKAIDTPVTKVIGERGRKNLSNIGTLGSGSSSKRALSRFGTLAALSPDPSTTLAVAGPAATFAFSRNERGIDKFFDKVSLKDTSPTPPPVTAGPGVGAGTNTAVIAARRRAVAAAAARRRGSQTVTTTPLGVTERAATSKKRLLGE